METESIRRCVADALDRLPEGDGKIATFLRENGHRAVPSNGRISRTCPIAVYLKATCGEDVSAGYAFVMAADGELTWDVRVPRKVVSFMVAFDRGLYPDLLPV